MRRLASVRDLPYWLEVSIGERLRNARERKGLTQAELGAVLGVSQNTIACWENETTQPRRSRIKSLAKELGLRPADLLAGLVEASS